MLFPADLTAKEKEKGQCRVKTEEIIPVNRLVVLRRQKVRGCFRCNYTDHKAPDPNCPARSKKYNACGEIGHFVVCCKIKERKPLTRDDEGRNNTRGRAYQLSEDSASGQQDYFAFTVGVGQPTSGSEVDLKV